MSQNWVVGLVVGLAAVYSVWYVLPSGARKRLGRLHRALGRAPSCSSSCDSCGKCSSSGTGGGAPADAGQVHPVHFHHKG